MILDTLKIMVVFPLLIEKFYKVQLLYCLTFVTKGRSKRVGRIDYSAILI